MVAPVPVPVGGPLVVPVPRGPGAVPVAPRDALGVGVLVGVWLVGRGAWPAGPVVPVAPEGDAPAVAVPVPVGQQDAAGPWAREPAGWDWAPVAAPAVPVPVVVVRVDPGPVDSPREPGA